VSSYISKGTLTLAHSTKKHEKIEVRIRKTIEDRIRNEQYNNIYHIHVTIRDHAILLPEIKCSVILLKELKYISGSEQYVAGDKY